VAVECWRTPEDFAGVADPLERTRVP